MAPAQPPSFCMSRCAGAFGSVDRMRGMPRIHSWSVDAAVLAAGMVQWLNHGNDAALVAYSSTRLPDVWQTQAFSRWVLELCCAQVDGDPSTRQLQRTWVEMLHASPSAARARSTLVPPNGRTCRLPRAECTHRS